MSISNDGHQITRLCVPDGTRNGNPVWKVMDENPLLYMFDKELPDDVDKTQDFYWTTKLNIVHVDVFLKF